MPVGELGGPHLFKVAQTIFFPHVASGRRATFRQGLRVHFCMNHKERRSSKYQSPIHNKFTGWKLGVLSQDAHTPRDIRRSLRCVTRDRSSEESLPLRDLGQRIYCGLSEFTSNPALKIRKRK